MYFIIGSINDSSRFDRRHRLCFDILGKQLENRSGCIYPDHISFDEHSVFQGKIILFLEIFPLESSEGLNYILDIDSARFDGPQRSGSEHLGA